MILFLDFDGVLHHENVTVKRCPPSERRYLKAHESRFLTRDGKLVKGKDLFEHADRLAAALAPFPNVRIVISSTWREHFRPEKLLQFLPAALADRVIGHTPLCDKFGGVGSRLSEVLAYLEGNGLAGEPWIALDDQAQLFWDDTENPPDNLFILKGGEAFAESVASAFIGELLNRQPLTDKKHYEQPVAPQFEASFTAEDIQRAIADEECLGARTLPSDALKVYLDDERIAPEGWVQVRWPDEAIKLLQTGSVSHLSLDHDLGDDQRGTGYDVLLWIEQEVVSSKFIPPSKIEVHSANPAARKRMLVAIESIRLHLSQMERNAQ